MPPKLLNLGFLVDHVLTRDGVVLFHFKLVGHGPLVLVRGVKMTGTRRRIHSNFFAHDSILRLSRRGHANPQGPLQYRAYQ